jgi:hypothetical protein
MLEGEIAAPEPCMGQPTISASFAGKDRETLLYMVVQEGGRVECCLP